MDFNNQVDERLKEFIVEHTNITAEQYESKTRHQWFLSAKEMKELNLVDRIIGDDDI
jgi:ATP-dependent protease ClpP protease subunit